MFFSCPCGITLEVHLDCVERCLFVLGLHNDYLKTTSGLCYDLMGIPICSLRSIWVTLGSIPGQIGMSFASAWGQFESSLASVVDYRVNSECIYNDVGHMLHHIKNSLDYSGVGFKEYYWSPPLVSKSPLPPHVSSYLFINWVRHLASHSAVCQDRKFMNRGVIGIVPWNTQYPHTTPIPSTMMHHEYAWCSMSTHDDASWVLMMHHECSWNIMGIHEASWEPSFLDFSDFHLLIFWITLICV